MAVTITPEDVKEFCPEAAGIPDATIEMYIAIINQADDCLDANNVSDDLQRALKLNGVCHLLQKQNGGLVKSERDFNGASATYANDKLPQYGLASTYFGQFILTSGLSTCFAFINAKPQRYLLSAGDDFYS